MSRPFLRSLQHCGCSISEGPAGISRISAPIEHDIGLISAVLTDVGAGRHSGVMEVRVLGALTLDDGRIPLAPRDRAVMGCAHGPPGSTPVHGISRGGAVGRGTARLVVACHSRVHHAVAPAHRAGADRNHAARVPTDSGARRGRRRAIRATRRAGYAAAGVGGARTCRAHARGGARTVAGRALRRTPRLGTGSDRVRTSGGDAPRCRGAASGRTAPGG